MSPPRLAAAANAPTTRPRMQRDYTIQGGITLVQPPHELDLHNDFAFLGLEYSIEQRTAVLRWRRREGTWVRPTLPASASITFQDVRELRIPRHRSAEQRIAALRALVHKVLSIVPFA